MFRISRAASLVLALFALPTVVSAQATRTWVSGVGDDANPGSRTAPCKTFAGAISKTAPSGEIDALDPGGFGALTITKAITIDGSATLAGVLVSGTNGIVVNAGASDVVILRHLDFNGLGTGLAGVKFIAGKALIIEDCTFTGFTTGISVELAVSANVIVSNTSVINSSGAAFSVSPTSGAPIASISLNNVRFIQNTLDGIVAGAGAHITVKNSTLSNNGIYGVYTYAPTASVFIDNSNISHNTSYGVRTNQGTVRISNCVITDNGQGLAVTAGAVQSYVNNQVDGNITMDGTPSGTLSFK